MCHTILESRTRWTYGDNMIIECLELKCLYLLFYSYCFCVPEKKWIILSYDDVGLNKLCG